MQVCLSTIQFENFISTFLNRVFRMIELLSTDISDAEMITDEVNNENRSIELLLQSILLNIVQQCSSKIYQLVLEKITHFRALKCLLPKTYKSIEQIMINVDTTEAFINGKENLEVIWHLALFSELVHARDDVLLIYQQMIMSIFHRCIPIMPKKTYEIVANAASYLLKSLTRVYPIFCQFE
ncbi:unnamed protein product [Rotaria sp. Silwood2]|nr:unnamed protein product [Rotaria sp. Silwood2]CAF2806424.1 unnamed protein product [Rotaria sp. Silwood2]CAF3093696.1 unnamed protein product [Rotaria sp. Silwood2]CAF3205190.1 unnamed protein product [Rotaria sp. Silwood2]CAF3899107.1 unnamed protein product [Rotaria sp. Silwood2]